MNFPALTDLPNNPAVILADPSLPFAHIQIDFWQSMGIDTILVGYLGKNNSYVNDKGIFILSCQDYFELPRYNYRKFLEYFFRKVEYIFAKPNTESDNSALYITPQRILLVSENILRNWLLAKFVQQLNPRFVYGHEIFYNGLATAFCDNIPRILMPYGKDIYNDINLSWQYFYMIGWALNHVDYVCPSAMSAAAYIQQKFHVASHKVDGLSWGVDRSLFQNADVSKRQEICDKYQIDASKHIIINSRRFRPAWGAISISDAFIDIAQRRSDCHFILLGGASQDIEFLLSIKKQIIRLGINDKFLIFEDSVPMETIVELFSISDIFLSLPQFTDLHSQSITQASSAGAVPILGNNQREYVEMQKKGFQAVFVEPQKVEDIIGAIEQLLGDAERCQTIIQNNLNYIEKYEDFDNQQRLILEKIDNICQIYNQSVFD